MSIEKYKRAYFDHKYNAKARGIGFFLSIEEWYRIWEESGHLPQRGRRSQQYCMTRFHDKGNYEVGNVEIRTVHENCRDNGILQTCDGKGIRRGFSEERRKKISKAHKGKVVSVETRKKQSDAQKGHKGHVHTDEQRARMTISNNKKWSPGGCFYENYDEFRLKISATKRAKPKGELSAATKRGWETRRRNAQNKIQA